MKEKINELFKAYQELNDEYVELKKLYLEELSSKYDELYKAYQEYAVGKDSHDYFVTSLDRYVTDARVSLWHLKTRKCTSEGLGDFDESNFNMYADLFNQNIEVAKKLMQ